MKVVIVTMGEYSSEQPIAVFSLDKFAEAERIAELTGGRVIGDPEEAFELDGYSLDGESPPLGMNGFYELSLKREGDLDYCRELPMLECVNSYFGAHDKWTRRPQFYEVKDRPKRPSKWRLHVHVYAQSQEHAIKIANDTRAQIAAGAKPPKGNLP